MRVAIAGATGRMGQMLIEATLAAPDLSLAAALDRPDSPALGRDAGEFMGRTSGVKITADLAALAGAEVLIDFTRPEATLAHLAACSARGVKMVIGTTGFDGAGRAAIAAAAEHIAIVFAPNMSVGVNAAFKLIEQAAKILSGYDVEVLEMHHRHKVDAPSGTALKMGEVIAAAQGVKLEDVAVWERHGHTGERKPGSIGFATLRGGDVVGEHTVIFAAPGERIEVSHKSSSRLGYAMGSLRAARFLASRNNGLFDMADVLGLA
ncbi:MAG: hypothetical protein RL669_1304 [Pseudomonadota bacterium]